MYRVFRLIVVQNISTDRRGIVNTLRFKTKRSDLNKILNFNQILFISSNTCGMLKRLTMG